MSAAARAGALGGLPPGLRQGLAERSGAELGLISDACVHGIRFVVYRDFGICIVSWVIGFKVPGFAGSRSKVWTV